MTGTIYRVEFFDGEWILWDEYVSKDEAERWVNWLSIHAEIGDSDLRVVEQEGQDCPCF